MENLRSRIRGFTRRIEAHYRKADHDAKESNWRATLLERFLVQQSSIADRLNMSVLENRPS